MILPDFSSLFQNSLTFPWLENAFPFSQVFQSEWEPCYNVIKPFLNYLFLGVEDLPLCVFRLLQLLSLEVLVVQVISDLDLVDIQPRFGGDGVDLVDATQGTTIQMERP